MRANGHLTLIHSGTHKTNVDKKRRFIQANSKHYQVVVTTKRTAGKRYFLGKAFREEGNSSPSPSILTRYKNLSVVFPRKTFFACGQP